jgi:L,D-peptidoglycan transpeptidase YkuD (ErfK/YbiS/YcfS/YnhG family)
MSGKLAATAVAVAALLTGCQHAARPDATPTAPAPAVASTPSPTQSRLATPHRLRVAHPKPARPTARPRPGATAPPRHAATPPLLVTRLVGVGDARQVIAVTAPGYGNSYATLTAYAKTASGWRQVFGPWSARIGWNGFAPRGAKHEGDGRTPTGSFGFSFFFGVDANPGGLHYSYRPALSTSYWDDDPSSANYNEWVDSRYDETGRAPEPMHQVPAYDYAAVIAYNTARTPGAGSAIFLHVDHGSATAGCVAIEQSRLLRLLRWLEPSMWPRIVMGTTSSVTR